MWRGAAQGNGCLIPPGRRLPLAEMPSTYHECTESNFDLWKWAKLIDERISLVAFGSKDELSGHVGDVASFMEHRKQCVLLQSDQMPVYALLKPSQQLYAAHERRKPGSKTCLDHQAKLGALSGGHGTASMHPLDELEQAKPGSISQKRGADHVGQDKRQATVELAHAIFHWLGESKRPVNKHGKHSFPTTSS